MVIKMYNIKKCIKYIETNICRQKRLFSLRGGPDNAYPPKVNNHYKETPKIPNQIHAHRRGNNQRCQSKTKTIKKE